MKFEGLFQNLKPAIYNYKDMNGLDSTKLFFGVMAQDIQKGLSDDGYDPKEFSIVKEKDGFLSVDYVQLIPLLISKIKELESEVGKLKQKEELK